MVLPYLCAACPVQMMLAALTAQDNLLCISVYNLIPISGPYLLSNFVDHYYYYSIVEKIVDESKFIRGLYGIAGNVEEEPGSTVMLSKSLLIENSLLQDYQLPCCVATAILTL